MPRHGIVVLDKPDGMSSNRAMSRLKHLLGIRKMGFLGTLDPLATGVLPVFAGKSTKLIPAFEQADKRYDVTMRLGEETDTYDAEGNIVARHEIGGLSDRMVRETIAGYEGEVEQTVPDFSAVKHQGVPAYRLARKGQPVPRRTRIVRLEDIRVAWVALPDVQFSITCSSGAYMRSLVQDIGGALGVGAHVTALRRTRCGPWFAIEKSIRLEDVAERVAREDFGFLANPASMLDDYWPMTVGDDHVEALRQGRTIPLVADFAKEGSLAGGAPQKVKALGSCGTLLAIGEAVPWQQGQWGFQPRRVLV